MKQKICKWILTRMGWKAGYIKSDIPKCVICVAPHTSNWDFIIGKLFYTSLGRFAYFLIKKEWFFFPLNYIFSRMGGIPVDRNKKGSLTDILAEEFTKREKFQLAITPEGTRKKVDKWKRGFYYIAVKANVPIMLVYIDYVKKEVGYFEAFIPTGDEEADIAYIKRKYEKVQPLHAERFK